MAKLRAETRVQPGNFSPRGDAQDASAVAHPPHILERRDYSAQSPPHPRDRLESTVLVPRGPIFTSPRTSPADRPLRRPRASSPIRFSFQSARTGHEPIVPRRETVKGLIRGRRDGEKRQRGTRRYVTLNLYVRRFEFFALQKSRKFQECQCIIFHLPAHF